MNAIRIDITGPSYRQHVAKERTKTRKRNPPKPIALSAVAAWITILPPRPSFVRNWTTRSWISDLP